MAVKRIATKFNITTPDVRTVYLKKVVKQKARYLQLPASYNNDILNKDIKAGAGIYGTFPETLKLNSTQYNVILSPTEEDGLRAVSYLAGIHAVEDGYEHAQWTEDTPIEEGEIDFLELDEELKNMFSDDDMEEMKVDFLESFERIPLVTISEVVAQEREGNPNFASGFYNMEMQSNAKKYKPWWDTCTEEAIGIAVSNNIKFGLFGEETLSDEDIESLQRFSENRRVYVLIVGEEVDEQDCSVTRLLLDYTANCFKVESKEGALLKYYRCLLENEAARRGFTFSKAMDVPTLTEKLSAIDKEYPCDRFSKIMDYLVHINAPKCLKAKDFERLGLKNMLERLTKADSTLEAELVGM